MSVDSEVGESQRLSKLLERVSELQSEKERLAAAAKKVNKELDELEQLAVEELSLSGLEGVRAAGKSWFTREFFSVSVPLERRAAVVAAARDEGLDDMIAVNTSTLKAWLLENRAQKEGDDANGGSLASGTPFEGLVNEYREVRLSHRTIG